MMQNIHAHRGFAQISSKILFYSIIILSSQRSMASEVVEVVGEVATTATVDGLAIAFGVVSCVDASAKLYSAGKEITTYTFPSEKERTRILGVSEMLELVKARKLFRLCLKNNRSNLNMSPSGYPTICKDTAQMLVMCGGEGEVERMISFNEMKKGK